MATWWRRIRISAVFHVSSRRDSRSHEVTRMMRRKTNRRHMIGDHHRRATGTATLLLTALDGMSARTGHGIANPPATDKLLARPLRDHAVWLELSQPFDVGANDVLGGVHLLLDMDVSPHEFFDPGPRDPIRLGDVLEHLNLRAHSGNERLELALNVGLGRQLLHQASLDDRRVHVGLVLEPLQLLGRYLVT